MSWISILPVASSFFSFYSFFLVMILPFCRCGSLNYCVSLQWFYSFPSSPFHPPFSTLLSSFSSSSTLFSCQPVSSHPYFLFLILFFLLYLLILLPSPSSFLSPLAASLPECFAFFSLSLSLPFTSFFCSSSLSTLYPVLSFPRSPASLFLF